MAFARMREFDFRGVDRTIKNYDAVQERLKTLGNPPEGGIFHTAGFDEEAGVFRVFDVWETREQGERFHREQVMPVLEELRSRGADLVPPIRETWYELHELVPN
jgi:hypothetical protein